jgi:heme-degrading monooxygenase HmoA
MQDILIRIETQDYEAWLATHYDHVEDRRAHGIADGPVYRDIDDTNAALFHIRVESMDRAMEWFGSEKFREASKRAKVTGREFYLAKKRAPAGAPEHG